MELFAQIINYLPRRAIQNMRLVNHEFEQKVSGRLFKSVVVPFRPEIYGITEDPLRGAGYDAKGKGIEDHRNHDGNKTVMLQDKGMRVFQGFGRHIRKFAMSFEFDIDTLNQPPIKCDQEAITSFWGIYRWPYQIYNRYIQLEGLEQTADETCTMAKALRYIDNANELGLSINGGLGWLSGPDVSTRLDTVAEKISVFGSSGYVSDIKPQKPRSRTSATSISKPLVPGDERIHIYERMLVEAGYKGQRLEGATRELIRSERSVVAVKSEIDSDTDVHEQESARTPQSDQQRSAVLDARNGRIEASTLPSIAINVLTSWGADSPNLSSSDLINIPLVPNKLSNAQKEMLLETEWAQRAFTQSYAIAVIDNPTTFHNIETLTIARIPARHLSILRRNDFWNSLAKLQNVSLAVIPDWRELIKLPTTQVEDVELVPSDCIPTVHGLLRDHIAPKKSIKSLHFEWLCGGEEAFGLCARNRLILAAPILENSMCMVNMVEQPSLLHFPYLKNFSLKNCWFSPHMLVRFITGHRKDSLRTLKLDSVSLSALPTRAVHMPSIRLHAQLPAAQLGHALAPHFMQTQTPATDQGHDQENYIEHALQPGPVPAVNQVPFPAFPTADIAPPHGPSQDWAPEPRIGSWAHAIDQITPGEDIRTRRHDHKLDNKPPHRSSSNLTRVTFASCGYIRLPLDLDQAALEPPTAQQDSAIITKRRAELDPFMMHRADYTLGTIIPHINHQEWQLLENAFFMEAGWDDYDEFYNKLFEQAKIDGNPYPGKGRFRGSISATPWSNRAHST
jgi:hypothetical protein